MTEITPIYKRQLGGEQIYIMVGLLTDGVIKYYESYDDVLANMIEIEDKEEKSKLASEFFSEIREVTISNSQLYTANTITNEFEKYDYELRNK